MATLGVELSDAGILAAGGRPARLLEIDQEAFASPGYALFQKKKALTGRAAERMAHLFPQRILHHFWDRLSTEPLSLPTKDAHNQAEVAFIHLQHMWDKVRAFGDAVAMAVPDNYTRTQLELLLGMAQELGIVVRGFWPISIAAAAEPEQGEMLLYLDIHLHRMELTCMRQAERLYHTDTMTLPGKGMLNWHREWVDAIASEFVHTTRFDPLHRAETEQELYDRLPAITAALRDSGAAGIEIQAGQATYRTTVTTQQLLSRNAGCLEELHRAIRQMQVRWELAADSPVALLVSHRIAAMPGVVGNLAEHANVRVRELRAGAAAMGAMAQCDGGDTRNNESTTLFVKSKPWAPISADFEKAATAAESAAHQPSHLLVGSVAYPVGENPLAIGCHADSRGSSVYVGRNASGAGTSRCIIFKRAGRVFLKTQDVTGLTVNGRPISGSVVLQLGDVIRLAASDDARVTVIACLQNNEA